MNEGKVVERGTYKELMDGGGVFEKFVREFGGKGEEQDDKTIKEGGAEEIVEAKGDSKDGGEKKMKKATGIMQAEERTKGSVSWRSEFILAFPYYGWHLTFSSSS